MADIEAGQCRRSRAWCRAQWRARVLAQGCTDFRGRIIAGSMGCIQRVFIGGSGGCVRRATLTECVGRRPGRVAMAMAARTAAGATAISNALWAGGGHLLDGQDRNKPFLGRIVLAAAGMS